MSHIVPISKVNQFLPQEKLSLDVTVDQNTGLPVDHYLIGDLEETARDIIVGKLRRRFVTSVWFPTLEPGETASPLTPSILLTVAGMLVAGWVYSRQFSEESASGDSYGRSKVDEAYSLLEKILEGEISLGVDEVTPEGFPTTLETDPTFRMEDIY